MKTLTSFLFLLLLSTNIFAAKMASQVRSVPKAIVEATFQKPKDNLNVLVSSLVKGSSDTSGKVKIIHDWICDNISYDTEMYFSGWVSKQDYVSVLKKKKAVCSGYVSLMNEMCRLAGIESIGISGYSKGFGYTGKIDGRPDHEWNAIKIGNTWKLVDACWDAGFVDMRSFIKHYSTEWLFLAPEYFIYSHLPIDEKYQFLKTPKTKEEFVKEPYVAGKFFENGFRLGKNAPDYTNIISEETSYDFEMKGGYSVLSELIHSDTHQFIENAIWINRTGLKFSINTDVPDSQKYEGVIYAKRVNEENYGDIFPIPEFEQRIMPSAENLLANKKITQKEFDDFSEAFFKIEENGRYYLSEDLFATSRNNAIKKILKLSDCPNNIHDPILTFEIKADSSYTGFGSKKKFPSTYSTYGTSVSTNLISPIEGILKKNSKVQFKIESREYLKMAVKVTDSLIPLTKNPKTGCFEGEFEITNTDKVIVYGSKGSQSYSGLWFYEVE